MNFRNAVLSLIFMILSISSTSAIEGSWQGPGWSQTHRTERVCDLIYFQFSVDEQSVTLVTGGYRCGILQAEYPYSRFERAENGDLLFRGETVGFYDGRTLKLERPQDFFEVEFDVVENELRYREIWDDGRSFLQIEGNLVIVQ